MAKANEPKLLQIPQSKENKKGDRILLSVNVPVNQPIVMDEKNTLKYMFFCFVYFLPVGGIDQLIITYSKLCRHKKGYS